MPDKGSGTPSTTGASRVTPADEFTGDNKVVWERWSKKRTFVRALEGTYGELKEELYNQPRVYKTSDLKWKGGPQNFGKKVINPQACRVAQSIEAHIDVFAPGGYGQIHGHMNSAVFFVLKGKGHDIHDGRRMDWEAGDALIVENACVHQHLSDDQDGETIVLVMKAKPLFLFMHMIFQEVVQFPPTDPVPGHEDYRPPELSTVIHGDMAVAHYLYMNARENNEGETEVSNGRYTDILVRSDGEWKFIAWHGGDDHSDD